MPVRVNKTLGANDRCSPSGAVISAFLLAVIEGDMIIGWMKNSAFSVQQPQPDGTLTPLDLTAAGLASQADSADMMANKADNRRQLADCSAQHGNKISIFLQARSCIRARYGTNI